MFAAFSTMLFRLRILFTEPTDVPPNFITFICCCLARFHFQFANLLFLYNKPFLKLINFIKIQTELLRFVNNLLKNYWNKPFLNPYWFRSCLIFKTSFIFRDFRFAVFNIRTASHTIQTKYINVSITSDRSHISPLYLSFSRAYFTILKA